MPYYMRVIKAQDFIQLKANGSEIDLVNSRRALSNLAAECVARDVTCALLDVRSVRSSALSLDDMYELATSFHEMGFRPEHRIAILLSMPPPEKTRFLVNQGTKQGWAIRAFDNFELVLEWFSEVEPVGTLHR